MLVHGFKLASQFDGTRPVSVVLYCPPSTAIFNHPVFSLIVCIISHVFESTIEDHCEGEFASLSRALSLGDGIADKDYDNLLLLLLRKALLIIVHSLVQFLLIDAWLTFYRMDHQNIDKQSYQYYFHERRCHSTLKVFH